MNSKTHLTIGSKCPPLKEGLVRIYSMRFCPFAQRALLSATAKGVPLDVVNCNLKKKPEWLFQKNPGGKVPTVEISGKEETLYESLIVADYFDDAYPGRSLKSEDPFVRALDRIFIERFNPIIGMFFRSDGHPSPENEKLVEELLNSFQPFEDELIRRGHSFFRGSDAPGMLDYMIWPIVERLPWLTRDYPTIFDMDKFVGKYPQLGKWIELMKNDSTVASVLERNDIHNRGDYEDLE